MRFDGIQHAKKIVSDNLGLVDFAIGLVNSVLKLPDRQVKIFGYSNYKRMGKQSCSSKIVFGLVRASYSLPVEQKLAFLSSWASHIKRACLMYFAVLLVLHCGSKRRQIVSSRSRTGHAISDGKSVAVHSEVVWFIRCRQE